MFTVTKEFKFVASRLLNGLPPYDTRGKMHMIAFTLKLTFWNKGLSDEGFVKDTDNDLKEFEEWVRVKLSNRHLNETLPIPTPTSELIAKFIYDTWKQKFRDLMSVEVHEYPDVSVKYSSE